MCVMASNSSQKDEGNTASLLGILASTSESIVSGVMQDLGHGEKPRSGSSTKPLSGHQNKDQVIPPEMINLAFLTRQERKFIKTVIQADLKFRSTVLGSLKRSIDEAQRSKSEELSGHNVTVSCTECGQKIITICSRVFAVKCSGCGKLICKKCAGKKNWVCVHCEKKRALELKVLDYESILHYGMHSSQTGAESTPFFAESELIEKSLHTASDPYSERRPVAQKISNECLVGMCALYREQGYSEIKISGYLYLAIWYISEEERLYVRIHKTRGLAEETDESLNLYVQIYLLPGLHKSDKRISGIQFDTSTPVWNEIVTYSDLTEEEVRTRTLWASLWNWSRYGRQQFLGEIHISLTNRDLAKSRSRRFQLCDSESLEVNICRPEKGLYKICGELLLELKFKNGYLYVKIIKAVGLIAVHGNVTFNPYIKMYLLPDWSNETTIKLRNNKQMADPVYNQILAYRVSEEDLQGRTLWMSIWNHNPVGTNLFMGETCISLAGNLHHPVEKWYELHDFADCGAIVTVTPFGHTLQKCFKPQPADIVQPQPADIIQPQPADIVEPQPADIIKPQPADIIQPQPADIVQPQPADIVEPQPANIFEPQPADIVQPQPADIVQPQPADIVQPQPADIVKLSGHNEGVQKDNVPLTVGIPTMKTEDTPTQDISKPEMEGTNT